MYHDELRKFSLVTKADLIYEAEDGSLSCLGGVPEDNPVMQCKGLRDRLRAGADGQAEPYMIKDEYEAYYACIRPKENEHYYLGPLCVARLNNISLRKFYRGYGIEPADVRLLHLFTIQEVLYITELVAQLLTRKTYAESELLYKNQILDADRTSLYQDQSSFFLQEENTDDMAETWRHTYREERKMLEAVQEGRVEDALALNHLMDDDSGRLGEHEFDHWRNLSIVDITLCARAAIEGGLSPEDAYRVSGYYILRCSKSQTVTQILDMRDMAVRDMATRVREKQSRHHSSNYTEVCKNYIARHYREKLYLNDVAQVLGISPTYLSHLFKKDTGIRFQDYVNQVRVERASNLLRYSDLELPAIAEYVHFPSQSYFGKIFKARMHMTPKEYRDRFKAAEWSAPGFPPGREP